MYINFDFCYQYKINDIKVEITIDYNLSCTSHEEADTKIVRHVQHFDSTIWIRCSDTDVLIIMLRNMDSFVQIYMKIGVGNTI